MILTLEIDGENKKFHSKEIKGITEYFPIVKRVDKLLRIKTFNEKAYQNMCKFVCKCFENKFTEKQLRSCIDLEDIIKICINLMNEYTKAIIENKKIKRK